MGCTPPAAFCAKVGVSITYEQESSVEEVSTIRLDIAKSANGLIRVARTAAGQRLLVVGSWQSAFSRSMDKAAMRFSKSASPDCPTKRTWCESLGETHILPEKWDLFFIRFVQSALLIC